MSLTDALTTLVDAARQGPSNRHLEAAIKRVELRIEALRRKRARMKPIGEQINQLTHDSR